MTAGDLRIPTAAGRHVVICGRRVFVREVGDGPPVVLLNGIGAHVEMWAVLERRLEEMRVISFDAPGTGRSERRPLPFTLAMLARLVEALFDRLELETADVVGYSFGGALAQQFAIQAPERVRRLVLAATLPGWGGVPGRLPALLSMLSPLRYYSWDFFAVTGPVVAGGRARTDREYLARLWHDRAGHAPSWLGYTQQLWAMGAWTSLPWLSRITAPTLVVVGDDDPLVPLSNAYMLAHRIPQARVFTVPGEGHFLLLDEESAAPPAIRGFLTTEAVEQAPAWRSASPVSSAALAAQLRADGLGALPWGLWSAAVRRVVGAVRPTS